MTDVLLTHSYHLPYDRKQAQKMEPYPPLGTLYAAGYLRANGISVVLFDSMLEQPEEGLRRALRLHKPKIVAIYEDDFNFLTKMCLTRMRELAWQMINIAHQHNAQVIVHGSDATDHAREFLERGAECVLRGEAEYSLLEAVNALLSGQSVANIPGVNCLRRGGSLESLQRSPRMISRGTSVLPLPARDLIDMSTYRKTWKDAHGTFSLNLVASRGCPFRCNWCAKPIFGDSYQLRPAEDVASEMRLLIEEYGAEHLWFADDIFGLNRHWLEELARAVETSGCIVPFKIQARADLLTRDSASALKRAGCTEVWMGVESGSQKILDAMDKGLLVEEVISAREHLRSEGIRGCYFLQLGYPGESWEDIQKTIALVRKTKPDDIGVSFAYPLPNTRFYARVREQLGAKQNWADSEDLCVMFKGTYTDRFYRAIRDALHAEVVSWKTKIPTNADTNVLRELWRSVESLEAVSQNEDATQLPKVKAGSRSTKCSVSSHFVSLQTTVTGAGEINE
ncbi:MAG: anaerobic magnesium-protoporphyrin monomethyl ester cyclase [Acidobacteriaceae bacterium]|nr:anaerobic magnesium-protoporphyrin monomethyl ester cyclase [Acidobacteriaceae bacterium]